MLRTVTSTKFRRNRLVPLKTLYRLCGFYMTYLEPSHFLPLCDMLLLSQTLPQTILQDGAKQTTQNLPSLVVNSLTCGFSYPGQSEDGTDFFLIRQHKPASQTNIQRQGTMSLGTLLVKVHFQESAELREERTQTSQELQDLIEGRRVQCLTETQLEDMILEGWCAIRPARYIICLK